MASKATKVSAGKTTFAGAVATVIILLLEKFVPELATPVMAAALVVIIRTLISYLKHK